MLNNTIKIISRIWNSGDEIIHQVKKERRSFLLKLDFEKTDDRVKWDCLMEVMRARKFGPRWMGWIESWQKSVKINTLVNRTPGREIACRRGLRQGDPLSPLLFTLVVDGLHAIIQKARKENLIKRLPASKRTLVSNLQYVDDTMLFDEWILRRQLCGSGSYILSNCGQS